MAARAYLWSAAEQLARQGLRFVLLVVLARLLSPEDFGLMGMLLVFMLIGQTFVDSGFSLGLIQRKEITADDQSSVFWFNVVLGACVGLLLCAISPLVAAFYRQPVLAPMLCAASLAIFIGSFGVVQIALLTRAVDFRTQAKVTTLATAASGILGVTLACRGYGVWSLVWQVVSQSCFTVCLLWSATAWRPLARFRWSSISSLWPFSSRLLASGILNTTFDNLYPLIIGRLYPVATLGYYTRASTLAMLPAGTATSVVTRVSLPIFSRLQHDPHLMLCRFRETLRLTSALYFPAMAFLAAAAHPVVQVLLGAKWLPSVVFLQVLCLVGMLYPVHALHLNVLNAMGRSDLFLRLEITKKVLLGVIVVATFRDGVTAMAWGLVVHSALALGINGFYTKSLLGYRWTVQAWDLLLPLMIAAAVWTAAIAVRGSFIPAPAVQLLIQVAVGCAVTVFLVWVLRESVYRDVWRLAFRRPASPDGIA